MNAAIVILSLSERLVVRWIILLAAVQQILFPFFVNPFAEDNPSFRRASTESGTEPAAYAFSIWGPIYLGSLAYAIWQVTAGGKNDSATAKVWLPVVLLFAGSSIWLTFAKFGPVWMTMPTLAVMAWCAVRILWCGTRTPSPLPTRAWFMNVPFGLYAGWTCCAVFVNVAEVAPAYGWRRFGLSRDSYAIASIASAVVLSAVIIWSTYGNLAFAGAVLWALLAIAVAARQRSLPNGIALASLAGCVLVVAESIAVRWLSRPD